MSIVLQSTGGGSVTINEPTTASNFTQTLPAATGDVMVSGNMPAFSAYPSASATPTSNVWTKVACNTEVFDTNNCFDSTTNYRFTPTVAGYYQISASCDNGGTGYTSGLAGIYKNGSLYSILGGPYVITTGSQEFISGGTTLIYFNGTTDYVEFYMRIVATSGATIYGGALYTSFSGSLVRTA
jgi:hypothetical protein